MSTVETTGSAITSIAEKLQAMHEQFTVEEYDALYAVFHLAGIALASDPDVEGFAVDMFHGWDVKTIKGLNFTLPAAFTEGLAARQPVR